MEDSLKRTLKDIKSNESTVSMFLGGVVVLIVGVLLYNFFVRPEPQISNESTATESADVALNEQNGEDINLPTQHTVTAGEHLWAIAQSYYESGYNWVDIAETNGLSENTSLAVGQRLIIPDVPVRIPGQVVKERAVMQEVVVSAVIEGEGYLVQQGDTLWDIAVRSYGDGYQWPTIFSANRDILDDASVIEVGQRLRIPRD